MKAGRAAALLGAGFLCAQAEGAGLEICARCRGQGSTTSSRGAEVAIRARDIAPGEMLVVAVSGHDDALPPSGSFGSVPLAFFRVSSGTFLAFAGIDLETPPGSIPLKLKLTDPAGTARAEETRNIAVGRKVFSTQHISLPERYVTLNPEDEKRAQDEAEQLKRLFSRETRETYFNGRFASPIAGAPASNFGSRRVLNGIPKDPHSGLDLRAPEWTPVRAPGGGKVALTADFFYQGNVVVLDHGAGLFSAYMHLSSLSVSQGQVVGRGDTLGTVGRTGRVKGAHLHWSVKLGQARIDPSSLLALELGP